MLSMEYDRTRKGAFIISLDFELLWGLVDVVSVRDFEKIASETRRAIPKILDLFEEFKIHASWAAVGFLFFDNHEELLRHLPTCKPDYHNPQLSTYSYLSDVGEDEHLDPAHFGRSLIREIHATAGQEIASHTFSHYYCLEPGQTHEAFQQDLYAARLIADKLNIELKSLVFPRNQVNAGYLPILTVAGINSYRGEMVGNRLSQAIKALPVTLVRCFRLLDAYIKLSGENAFDIQAQTTSLPLNIPASRFLRPYTGITAPLEPLRLRRISTSLEFAAKNNLAYHLWWHPHNFSKNPQQNLFFLRKILIKFSEMRERYGMETLNMREVTTRVFPEK